MAKHNPRTPLQVSPEFLNKLKELQRKIRMQTGDDKSLRELTDHIASSGILNDVDKMISNKSNKIDMDIKVRFDRRMLK
jgi:hypothetical protein